MKNLLLTKNSICTIISHTPYCMNNNGIIVGLGPTVEEIDYLSTLFKKIFHCAPLHDYDPPSSYIEHKQKNITFIPLKPMGGKNFNQKLNHLIFFPFNLKKIKFCLKLSNVIHFRAPTGIGVLFIPWMYFFWNRSIWIKYAGSWEDSSSPLSYKLQRWYLKRFPKKVVISINGCYPKLKSNFYDFINPCFNQKTFKIATKIANKKNFSDQLNLLFVGRLEKEKGLDELFMLIEKIHPTKLINSLTIIGQSSDFEKYTLWAKNLSIEVNFCGPLPRKEIFDYYANSHILILLSKSEGFPKVIMEAGAFGCVSIVSDLKQIKNVIKDKYNGFIINNDSVRKHNMFMQIINDRKKLRFCSRNINRKAKSFTFENYLELVENAILY